MCVLPILLQFQAFSLAATRLFVLEQGENGYFGFEDTSIYSENENAGGGNDGVFVGTTNQIEDRRALLRVDLSFLPPDAQVLSVELKMTVERSGGNFGFFDIELRRLTRDWGEGTVVGALEGGFGGPPGEGDATWISNHHGQSLWTNPGGDFAAEASATAPSGQQDSVTVWSGPQMAADVQAWAADPPSNFGWVVISTIEGQRQRVKKFFSSEAAVNRPVLTIAAEVPESGDAQHGKGRESR
jgi:hypothetical protein